jgi:hypothetical protein
MRATHELFIWPIMGLLAGCATAPPEPISAQQVRTFHETVRIAEQATLAAGNADAEAVLRSAKSDFYYAEHSPMDPERARLMAARAQAEAESAVALSRGLAAAKLGDATSSEK